MQHVLTKRKLLITFFGFKDAQQKNSLKKIPTLI